MKDYNKAEEFYQKALEGYVAQLGKESEATKRCARNFAIVLEKEREKTKLRKLLDDYPHLLSERWDVNDEDENDDEEEESDDEEGDDGIVFYEFKFGFCFYFTHLYLKIVYTIVYELLYMSGITL